PGAEMALPCPCAEHPGEGRAERGPRNPEATGRGCGEVVAGVPPLAAGGGGQDAHARRSARSRRWPVRGTRAAGAGDRRRPSRPRCAVIVVDASVIATGLADDGPDGDRIRATLRGQRLTAPQLIDLEVVSVWRRLVVAGELDERRARFALDDL